MKNEKLKWDLGLLYKNNKDPQIEKDIRKIEKNCISFSKKYNEVNLESKEVLLNALLDFERLKETISGSKPWWYFALQVDVDGKNEYAISEKTKMEMRLKKATNNITFFEINIGKIDIKKQKEILIDKKFEKFKYLLEKIFKFSKHKLSEKEEKIENLLSQTSYDMWVDGNEKLLKEQTIYFKKENIPISKAVSIIPELNKKERDELQEKINDKLMQISHFSEAEINAIFNYKKTMDELRGFKKPYSETILGYENEEKNIENLIKLVTENFKISHRFYKIHKKLLGLKSLEYQDRSAKIGNINKKMSFDNAVSIVKDSFSKFDSKYSNLLQDFINNGQIDVFPKVGKRGGAYCWGMGKMPTFILLNHTDNIRSIETLAHEMGHAIHTELSKAQPVFYRKYSTATAEVASTFFEQLAQNEIEKTLNEKEKIIFLHNKIMGDIATIFRQVACFNFENELHIEIRAKGIISKEEIAKLMIKHMQSYLGKEFKLKKEDGYLFVGWSHIRSFFYVYSYAYGQIISKSLLSMWEKNNAFKSKIEEFLKSGKSKSPEDIFKSIGINTNNPRFFLDGLKSIERDIEKLEKLTRKP